MSLTVAGAHISSSSWGSKRTRTEIIQLFYLIGCQLGSSISSCCTGFCSRSAKPEYTHTGLTCRYVQYHFFCRRLYYYLVRYHVLTIVYKPTTKQLPKLGAYPVLARFDHKTPLLHRKHTHAIMKYPHPLR